MNAKTGQNEQGADQVSISSVRVTDTDVQRRLRGLLGEEGFFGTPEAERCFSGVRFGSFDRHEIPHALVAELDSMSSDDLRSVTLEYDPGLSILDMAASSPVDGGCATYVMISLVNAFQALLKETRPACWRIRPRAHATSLTSALPARQVICSAMELRHKLGTSVGDMGLLFTSDITESGNPVVLQNYNDNTILVMASVPTEHGD